MNKETLKIVEAIGNDILTLATIIMEDDSISIKEQCLKIRYDTEDTSH